MNIDEDIYITEQEQSTLAKMIDSSWYYSMHWKGNGTQLHKQMQRDLNCEMEKAKSRVAELKKAQSALDAINE